jgi:hypothetical protein
VLNAAVAALDMIKARRSMPMFLTVKLMAPR